MERRKYERHDLSAPVKFHWQLSNDTRRDGMGITRDFSAGGLFVMTEDSPPVGASVHFEVDLKTSRLDSTVTIQAKGQVTRIEKTERVGRLGGFAIASRRMALRKPDPSFD